MSDNDWVGKAYKAGDEWIQAGIEEGMGPLEGAIRHNGFCYGALWQRTAMFDDQVVEKIAEQLWLTFEPAPLAIFWSDLDLTKSGPKTQRMIYLDWARMILTEALS